MKYSQQYFDLQTMLERAHDQYRKINPDDSKKRIVRLNQMILLVQKMMDEAAKTKITNTETI